MCTPCSRASGCSAATCPVRGTWTRTAGSSGRTRPRNRRRSGSSAAAGRSTRSRAGCRPVGCWTSWCPTGPRTSRCRDGHSAWANARALALAGVDRDTPDPADGRIERGPDGEPTGVLHEGAMGLVGDRTPPVSAARARAGLLAAQAHLHSLGITGWQDALVGAYGGNSDPLDTYLAADADGSLTARVRGALWWDREAGLEQIESLLARRAKAAAQGGRRFTAGSVKIMQDGVVENFSAAMLEPYLDSCGCPGDSPGSSMVDPALLREAAVRAGRRRLPDPLPRPRRPRRPRGPGLPGSRRRGQRPHRQPASPGPPPGRPPRRHPALSHPARHRQHPAAVGRPRTRHGRPHAALPGRGARRPPVSVRRTPRGGRDARGRQ